MPDEKPTTLATAEKLDIDEGTVLMYLTDCGEQQPWSIEEVIRQFGSKSAIDAVNALVATGLLHRMGDFVWATRAAVRAAQIKM